MQNSNVWTGITSLYGFQNSSVVFSTHNSVVCTRTRSLYLFQPSPVVLCTKNSDFRTRTTSPYGSETSPVVLCMQNSVLAPESLVFMGPSPLLWFLQAKQRLLDHNYKSLWIPDLTCRFLHANSMISTGISCLYGFQPWSVVLCIQNRDVKTKLHVSMCPRHHLLSSACKTAWIAPE